MDANAEREEALKNHQIIMSEYAAIRKNLSFREQHFFDKAMTLMEEIAEELAPPERILVLSAGIMAGMISCKMSQREYVMLAVGLGKAVLKVRLAGGKYGSSNRD